MCRGAGHAGVREERQVTRRQKTEDAELFSGNPVERKQQTCRSPFDKLRANGVRVGNVIEDLPLVLSLSKHEHGYSTCFARILICTIRQTETL